MEKQEMLSLLQRYILTVNFSNKEEKNEQIKNIIMARQVSPVSVLGVIQAESLIFKGRQLGECELRIPFAHIKEMMFSAYARLVPSKSHEVGFPTKLYYVYVACSTQDGLSIAFETRDYEGVRTLINKCKETHVEVDDVTNIKDIMEKGTSEEIDTYFEFNWDTIAKECGLPLHKSGYIRE